MSKQVIGIGTVPNDRTGDKLRVAFDKVNDNFTELYDGAGAPSNQLVNGEFVLELDDEGRLIVPEGYPIVYRKWGGADTAPAGHSTIQAGMGFHISSGEGVYLHSVDMTDEENPVTHTLRIDPTTGDVFIPIGRRLVYRAASLGEASHPADSYLQAGEGFHIRSGEGIYITAVNAADEENPVDHTFGVDTDGKVRLPGALYSDPVEPEAGIAADGVATAVSVSNSPNPNWTTGTGIFAGGINMTVAVDGSGNATVSIVDGGTGHYVGETFGPVAGTALGGTTPDDDINFVVDAVAEEQFSDLDLTKLVHVLSGVTYRLQDGYEGQIIYLVLGTGEDASAYSLTVVNARNGGTENTNWLFAPFQDGGDVVTMIFTQGAWQASGGIWD